MRIYEEEVIMTIYKEHGDINQEIWCNFEQEIGQDKETRYFVEWDITENIDEVIKNKLKNRLQINEDNYFTMDNMEGFCTSDEKEAIQFFSSLALIIDEQLNMWKEAVQ